MVVYFTGYQYIRRKVHALSELVVQIFVLIGVIRFYVIESYVSMISFRDFPYQVPSVLKKLDRLVIDMGKSGGIQGYCIGGPKDNGVAMITEKGNSFLITEMVKIIRVGMIVRLSTGLLFMKPFKVFSKKIMLAGQKFFHLPANFFRHPGVDENDIGNNGNKKKYQGYSKYNEDASGV
jgi:hypothetical protein